MPITAWIILFGAPGLLALARVTTWIVRLWYPRNRRPGYLEVGRRR